MESRPSGFRAAMTVLVLIAVASAPAIASWTYTKSTPLTWEFSDFGFEYWENPNGAGTSQSGTLQYSSYVFQSTYPTVRFNYCSSTGFGGVPPNTIWQHTASGGTWGTGSLLIQSNGSNNGASFGYCRKYADEYLPAADCDYAINKPGEELSWVRGVVVETKARTIGGLGTEPMDPYYTWGRHSGGGILVNMRNLTDNPLNAPPNTGNVGMTLGWDTNDPTVTTDDRISVRALDGSVVGQVAFDLGSDPYAPPVHTYRFAVRRSPLPLVPQNRLILVSAWVDDVLAFKNMTVQGGPTTTDDFVGLGVREAGSANTQNRPFGNEYDYLKVYENDPMPGDSTPPTAPTSLNAVVSGLSITLTWEASTDPTNDVIGYRLYRGSTYLGYVNAGDRRYVYTDLRGNSSYTLGVVAVDEVGNVSPMASLTAATTTYSWTYTQANPLVFEFDDNGTSEFINPFLTTGPTYVTHANAPLDGVVISQQRTHDAAGAALTTEVWKHTFNDAGTGTLTVQSNPDHAGMSWTGCVGGYADSTGYANPFTARNWEQPLDMARGIELSTRVKSVGGAGTAPAGYNWGYSTDPGGMCFQFGDLLLNPSGSASGSGDAALELGWFINDPTDPSKDELRLWSQSGVHAAVSFPLRASADPNNAPTNEFRMVARRSPLPLLQRQDTLLVTVYANGQPVPGLTNRTLVTNRWEGSDWILLGTNGIGASTAVNARGDQYDWVKLCEAATPASDTDNPTAPTGVSAVLTGSVAAKVTWLPSTDVTSGVIGYRVYRNSDYVSWVEAGVTSYQDNSLTKNSTNTYKVQAVDALGNATMSAVSNAVVTSPPSLTWEFDDNGNTTYRAPQTFITYPKQTHDYWFGEPTPTASNNSDGYVRWTPATTADNYYECTFSSGNGGSMTFQSNTPAPGTASKGALWIRSNDMTRAFQWIYHPDYPVAGQTFSRGPLVEADFDLVGDKNGWCAAWGGYPAMSGCTYTNDLYHAGSDWGGMSDVVERQLVEIVVAPSSNLSIPGHEAYGATGNGAQYIVGVHPKVMRDSTDDEIRVYSIAASYGGVWRLRIDDGVGLGLTAEDGTTDGAIDPLTHLPALRDGIIQSKSNNLKLEVGVLPAAGNNEYWDIWVTRPNGSKIHIDPSTCTATTSPTTGGFGVDGHTFMVDTAPATGGYNYNQLMFSQTRTSGGGEASGYRINSISLYNDYGTADVAAAQDVADIHQLKDPSMAGKLVKLTGKACTNAFGTAWYWIEEENRYSAIAVQPAAGAAVPTAGQRVTVQGTISTVAGATVLTGAAFTVAGTGAPLKTLGAISRTLSSGLDVDGLFIRVSGKVSYDATRTDAFYLNDGGVEVMVVIPAGQTRPAASSYVAVTGNLLRGTETALMVSSASAVTPYAP